jgi:pSer/pThr/pTyr-binding forkhead associated (FHA) protein
MAGYDTRQPPSPRELKELLAAERKGEPFLVYRDAAWCQRIFWLRRGHASIGRAPDVDLTIEADDEVSRLHASLEAVGETWTVVDDGLSTNGTFLNEERIRGRHRLADRDVLRVGRTTLTFRDPTQRPQGTTIRGTNLSSIQQLSPTQRRVLVALCRPYKDSGEFATPASNKQIGDEMFLGAEAIKKHLHVLYQRFNLDDLPQNQKRARLAEIALLSGLVTRREL